MQQRLTEEFLIVFGNNRAPSIHFLPVISCSSLRLPRRPPLQQHFPAPHTCRDTHTHIHTSSILLILLIILASFFFKTSTISCFLPVAPYNTGSHKFKSSRSYSMSYSHTHARAHTHTHTHTHTPHHTTQKSGIYLLILNDCWHSMPLVTLTLSQTHRAAVPAVLHIDIVAEVVPHALDAQEVVIRGAISDAGQRVDEEVLLDAPTSCQHQHPAVHPQPQQGVGRWRLALLFMKRDRVEREEKGLIPHNSSYLRDLSHQSCD